MTVVIPLSAVWTHAGSAPAALFLKRIVGHANADVTESYTHKNIRQLLTAINKLKY